MLFHSRFLISSEWKCCRLPHTLYNSCFYVFETLVWVLESLVNNLPASAQLFNSTWKNDPELLPQNKSPASWMSPAEYSAVSSLCNKRQVSCYVANKSILTVLQEQQNLCCSDWAVSFFFSFFWRWSMTTPHCLIYWARSESCSRRRGGKSSKCLNVSQF